MRVISRVGLLDRFMDMELVYVLALLHDIKAEERLV